MQPPVAAIAAAASQSAITAAASQSAIGTAVPLMQFTTAANDADAETSSLNLPSPMDISMHKFQILFLNLHFYNFFFVIFSPPPSSPKMR
jgi:hypothetical protein